MLDIIWNIISEIIRRSVLVCQLLTVRVLKIDCSELANVEYWSYFTNAIFDHDRTTDEIVVLGYVLKDFLGAM